MENTNNTIVVKCTRCGAKATVGGNDYFYTCPVCHGQINKEAAKKNYAGVSGNIQSAKTKYEREKTPIAQPKTATQSVQKPVTTSQTPSNPQKAANASNVKYAGIGKLFIAGGILLWLLLKSFIPVLSFIIGLLLVGFGFLCNDTENEITGKKEQKFQEELRKIEQERIEAIESQKATEPWAKRYSTHPCPHCGHYKVREATWDDKRYSVAFWGAASSKIGTRYKCDHCGNMWS